MAAQQDQATLLKNYCRGKNAEQVKVIEYFCKQEGCLCNIEDIVEVIPDKEEHTNGK